MDGEDHLGTLDGCLSSQDGLDCLCSFRSFPLLLPFLCWTVLRGLQNKYQNHPPSVSRQKLPVSVRFPETAWPCDISLELVDNLAKLSSKVVEVGPVDSSCPVISV